MRARRDATHAPAQARLGSADDAVMAKRSVRGLRRKMRATKSEKKAMTPQMRQLMTAFEAQYGQDAQFKQGRQQKPDPR
jgi:NUP50 (Nucleoporin 50 kDa)